MVPPSPACSPQATPWRAPPARPTAARAGHSARRWCSATASAWLCQPGSSASRRKLALISRDLCEFVSARRLRLVHSPRFIHKLSRRGCTHETPTVMIREMHVAALALIEELGGLATTAQLLAVMTRQQLDVQIRNGGLVRVWRGVYAASEPDLLGRLAALDLLMGQRAVPCMGTAAALYDFDLENTRAVHVLDPGVRMRRTVGLM